MIQMTEREFMSVIKKYHELGMNNVYWKYLDQTIENDLRKSKKERMTK
jgi:hypothetical protein